VTTNNRMGLSRFNHIAVEGAIGVGKTTLARRLAVALRAQLLLEKPEDNPFLEKFYADRARYALPTQLSFLFQRAEQARELMQGGMFTTLVVSDFMFAKDNLFAQLTLSDDEYKLYQRISHDVAPPTPRPDLVLWLRASPTTLLERVVQRGRPMEQGLEPGDLQALDERYAAYFARETAVPVLAVDTALAEVGRSDDALRALIERIAAFEGPREVFG
jgi:deoxyguanosine kinase